MIKIFLFLIQLMPFAQARVFDMQETSFGGFFSATYGNSAVNKNYFESESTATTFSKGFKINEGGEFGFIYNTNKVSWIFGLEVMKPPKITGIASTAGTANYSYSAEVSAYAPKFGVELVLFQNKDFRFFANGTFGSASLTSKSEYTNLTIAPNADFNVEGKGTANLTSYSLGGEAHWTDNTTVVFAMGYRQLEFKKIKYLNDVASSFTGAHTKGAQILKTDGSPLEYDFTNTFLTLGLRFWIH